MPQSEPGIEILLIDRYSEVQGRSRSIRTEPVEPKDGPVLLRQLVASAEGQGASSSQQRRVVPERLPKNAVHFDLASANTVTEQVLLGFGGVGGVLAFLKLVQVGIVKWKELSTRYAVKVKLPGATIEVKGTRDLEAVLEALKALDASQSKVKVTKPRTRKRSADA